MYTDTVVHKRVLRNITHLDYVIMSYVYSVSVSLSLDDKSSDLMGFFGEGRFLSSVIVPIGEYISWSDDKDLFESLL